MFCFRFNLQDCWKTYAYDKQNYDCSKCTLPNDSCVQSYFSPDFPISSCPGSPGLSHLILDFFSSFGYISCCAFLSRSVFSPTWFCLAPWFVLSRSALCPSTFPREILKVFPLFLHQLLFHPGKFILLSLLFSFRMVFPSGLFCLGLTIFGSFEILAVLAYFAVLHHFNVWTVSLITGICVLGPTGYSLFRLITEVISFVKFHRGEENPLDQRSKKQRITTLSITVSFLYFVDFFDNFVSDICFINICWIIWI